MVEHGAERSDFDIDRLGAGAIRQGEAITILVVEGPKVDLHLREATRTGRAGRSPRRACRLVGRGWRWRRRWQPSVEHGYPPHRGYADSICRPRANVLPPATTRRELAGICPSMLEAESGRRRLPGSTNGWRDGLELTSPSEVGCVAIIRLVSQTGMGRAAWRVTHRRCPPQVSCVMGNLGRSPSTQRSAPRAAVV